MTAQRRRLPVPPGRLVRGGRLPGLPGVAAIALVLAMVVRLPEAPATVAEQRARLPPAAECESDVEGRWRALIYSANTASWYDYRLEVRHVAQKPGASPSDELTGVIYVDTWFGTPEQSEPGACIGRGRYRGKMQGRGHYRNGEVFFGGGPFELTEIVCGQGMIGYNPDNFTGRLEKERQEFQSVNNDGGAAVNEPTVFRRIGCLDDQPLENPDVAPPPFFPERREGGC
jgi:hypothetical protein